MTLRQKQSLFVKLLARLFNYVYNQGWELTLGEGYQSLGQGHMRGSLHYIRLAQDLNLFVKDKYIRNYSPEYQKIGDYWKSLNSLCAWGGDFQDKDYNHFSLRHDGKE